MPEVNLICVRALKAEKANHPRFGPITLVVDEQYDLDQVEVDRLTNLQAVELVQPAAADSDSEAQE